MSAIVIKKLFFGFSRLRKQRTHSHLHAAHNRHKHTHTINIKGRKIAFVNCSEAKSEFRVLARQSFWSIIIPVALLAVRFCCLRS